MRFDRLADWLHWQETLHPRAVDLGVKRVRTVATRLGLNDAPPPIVTVGGTNGKGTTVACAERILLAAGYRPGAYTSPHLLRYNERIRLAGEDAPDELILRAFDAIDRVRGELTVTYFEFATLAALWCFRECGCDAWLLEVGLGGRLDAVNALDADVAVIVSVDVDHTELLGADRESIGAEKAGILRPGRPAVCADPTPPASVTATAARLGAGLRLIERDFGVRCGDGVWDYWQRQPQRHYEALSRPPGFSGDALLGNAAAAIAALETLADRLPVSAESIHRGLESVRVCGRFQTVDGPVPWVVDVAHNPASVRVLAAALTATPVLGRTYVVFGLMRRKDLDAVLEAFKVDVDGWFLMDLPDEDARGVDDLRAAVEAHDGRVAGAGSPAGVLDAVAAVAASDDRVVAFGSFRVAEEVLNGLSPQSSPTRATA